MSCERMMMKKHQQITESQHNIEKMIYDLLTKTKTDKDATKEERRRNYFYLF